MRGVEIIKRRDRRRYEYRSAYGRAWPHRSHLLTGGMRPDSNTGGSNMPDSFSTLAQARNTTPSPIVCPRSSNDALDEGAAQARMQHRSVTHDLG